MLTDTHAHLDYPDFARDLEEVLARARQHGVTRVLTIGTGVESSERAIALAERFPEVYAAVGIHPLHAAEASPGFEAKLRELAAHPKVVAIGETGLDYHRLSPHPAQPPIKANAASTTEDSKRDPHKAAMPARQAQVFRAQLELAASLGLNVILHQRAAWEDTLAILRDFQGRLRGVFHCFAGSPAQVEEAVSMGHCVSFTGIITFKNASSVREAAVAVPKGAFMVETDCPYLAPEPHRGQRCEPWHTRLVAERLATLRGTTLEDLARETEACAQAFFRFAA